MHRGAQRIRFVEERMRHRILITLTALSGALLVAACAPNAPLPGPTPIPPLSGPQPTLDPRLSAANVSASAGNAGDAGAGRALFEKTCAACHGPEGEGLTAPSLKTSTFVKGASDQAVFDTIAHGRIEKGMPAWSGAAGGVLSDDQIRDLVAFVREIQD